MVEPWPSPARFGWLSAPIVAYRIDNIFLNDHLQQSSDPSMLSLISTSRYLYYNRRTFTLKYKSRLTTLEPYCSSIQLGIAQRWPPLHRCSIFLVRFASRSTAMHWSMRIVSIAHHPIPWDLISERSSPLAAESTMKRSPSS